MTDLKADFIEKYKGKSIQYILSECYSGIFDVIKVLDEYRRLIIQHAPYDLVVTKEKEIGSRIVDLSLDFLALDTSEGGADGKNVYKFYCIEYKNYDLTGSDRDMLHRYAETSFQFIELSKKIFRAIQLGCSYDFYVQEKKILDSLLSKMENKEGKSVILSQEYKK